MKSFYITFFLFLLTAQLLAQTSSEKEILASYEARKKMAETSLLKNYPVRNIGPTVQGGRIVDIDVNVKNPKEFYIGFASGGIFKTINNGISFEPIFDNVDAIGIGDFVISQSDTKIIYVGTGEKNSSRSSYAGSGVYKTTDGGTTWKHLGLTGTQHISRVIIHPENNNTVWVGAIGALYSNNSERGVYKSTDGGNTWKKALYINDSTGVIDLVINPKNPNQLWASTWERSRTASNFKGHGPGSSIYRSDDGGETWKKSVAGFPQGSEVGRIGLEISPSQPNILYAVLDNFAETEVKRETDKDDKLKLEDLRAMSKNDFLKLDNKKLDEMLKDNRFPEKYRAEAVKQEVSEGKYTPKEISEYFGAPANQNLFRTKVTGAQIYRSEDAGTSWKKMNSYDLDGIYYTYGYYFGEMKIAPDDPNLVYIYGVPLLKSTDGGETWHRLDTLKGVKEIHVDHHALWINPYDSKHLLLGNDGGLYQSYDEGANWLHINNIPAGQFYTVNVDMERPYHVYGGLQDNGVLKGSSKSVPNETKHWKPIFSGDGMYVAPDPRNHHLVYTGYQFGNYFRMEIDKQKSTKITPQHAIGENPYRWNWRAPLILSKHNPDILYIGANKVFRSLNKGEKWEEISPDLTKNKKQGNVPISTISALSESPLKFGLLYVGTDDGNVWISKDGGGAWEPITNGLPGDRWVSSITPSPHDEATVFVSLNGYRLDEFKTYLFMSHDHGKTWRSVKGDLPESVANVIIQDPVNPDLLYCGLDNGTYVSFDKGAHWHLFHGMLNVPAYDMLVHPRENELVVATHGRSVFVADVKPLQALGQGGIQKPVVAFETESIRHSDKWGKKQYEWSKAHESNVQFIYYVGKPSQAIDVEIYDQRPNLVRRMSVAADRGFNLLNWDLKIEEVNPAVKAKTTASARASASPGEQQDNKATSGTSVKYAEKGKYTVRFSHGKDKHEVTFEIK